MSLEALEEIKNVEAEIIINSSNELTDILEKKSTKQKVGYLLCTGERNITRLIEDIDLIKIRIDHNLIEGQYRKAFMYLSILKRKVDELLLVLN